MPDEILIEKHPNIWTLYKKQYDLDEGAYYASDDTLDYLTGSFIQLYPDGHLTYLWNGIEHKWERNWKLA